MILISLVAGLLAAILIAGRVLSRRHRRHRLKTIEGLAELAPEAFERTIGIWLGHAGWLVEHRGGSGDEGIDLLAFHGSEVLAIQCKRYQPDGSVAPSYLRELYGSASAIGATSAVLVTTGQLTPRGLDWVARLPGRQPKFEVISGDRLAAMARSRRWYSIADPA
ncbi:MAG TPA: restriction endonuclease [Dehalococcoidia bacterium]|nr:restriction endonuclease [Dehalococcoidia bacterium]